MYLSFYGLKENPFQISTNPRFLWLGEKHQEALAALRYGILDNKGFLLLTGDVGTGKTTLINALLASLEDNVVAQTIPDPGLKQLDLYHYIAEIFGINGQFSSKGKFLVIFSRFLHSMHAKGKKVVLIIDEAQRLSPALLEEIRLLSNIEKPETKLINIFFVGQSEYNTALLREENRALRQRITVNYDISSLSLPETSAYIEHRLKIAGAARSLFSREAIKQIYLFSRGYPRLINVIADRSLLTGFVGEAPEIGPKIVLECARELKIPAPKLIRRKLEREKAADAESEEEVKAEEPPGGHEAGKAEESPSVAGREIEIPPQQDEGRDLDAAFPVTPDNSRKARPLLSALLVLIALLAITAGASFFFIPNLMQGVVSIFEKQPWLQFYLPEPADGPPGFNKPAGSAAVGSVPGPAATIQGKREAAADVQGDGSAGIGSGSVAAEEKDSVRSDEVNAVEETLPRTAEQAQGTDSAQGEELAHGGMAAENDLRASGTEAGLPDKPVIVGFDHNSNNLSSYGAFTLNRLAQRLLQNSYSRIVIRGYSDAIGSDSYNRNISLFRASIVKSYLMAKGIAPEAMKTFGLGSENPLDSNDTVEGRRKNRRVEIEVLP